MTSGTSPSSGQFVKGVYRNRLVVGEVCLIGVKRAQLLVEYDALDPQGNECHDLDAIPLAEIDSVTEIESEERDAYRALGRV